MSIDLVRLSQIALPMARPYDSDKNKKLNEAEFARFLKEWAKAYPTASPLLMQLHISTLNDDAKKIAQKYDADKLQGVLTESEIKGFIDECDAKGLNNIFNKGTTVQAVLTGKTDNLQYYSGTNYSEKGSSLLNNIRIQYLLAKNLAKLNLINYRGSDKFFHAVGNFEAMQHGSEISLKEFCRSQDKEKKDEARTECDRTEDLYANWLGRQFAKMYPDSDPHKLFSPLAPTGFDIRKSKESLPKLFCKEYKFELIGATTGAAAMVVAGKYLSKNISNYKNNPSSPSILKATAKFIMKHNLLKYSVLGALGMAVGYFIGKQFKQ